MFYATVAQWKRAELIPPHLEPGYFESDSHLMLSVGILTVHVRRTQSSHHGELRKLLALLQHRLQSSPYFRFKDWL